jgi:hypothetical protein
VQLFDDHNLSGDRAVAVATDKAGNIYVTGKGTRTTGPTTTAYEYVTIKYSPGGAILWQTPARYNNNNDTFYHEPIAIAVDQNTGDVYVTGTSQIKELASPVTTFTTVKYDTNGSEKWVKHSQIYTPDANDHPHAMCLDSAGNVYVTGTVWGSQGQPSNQDYHTISYGPAGNLRWAKTYRDGDPSYGHQGTPTAIVVDKNDNIIVTGYSYSAMNRDDFATIKYDKNGNVVWTLPYGAARYDGPAGLSDRPAAIAVDDLGNIYVTGVSSNLNIGSDPTSYATVKYAPNGAQLGVMRYNGTSPGVESYPTAIKVDAGGNNIVVTGTSKRPGATDYDIVTLSYTNIEQQIPPKEWRYAGVLDSNGNPINTAEKAVALAIKRWGPGGGPGGQPEGFAEKIFVTGTGGSGGDIVTLVYDPWGLAPPPLRLGGEIDKIVYPGGASAVPIDMVLDPKGNVVITGYKANDFLTIKYNLVRQKALSWLSLLLF